MTEIFMLTCPRSVNKKALQIMLEKNDCKKWIIAKETGKGGYEHWQIRVETSNDHFFDWVKIHIPEAHVEKASDTWEYERKEGVYWTSEDTNEIRQCRFGELTPQQKKIMKTIKNQDVRTVDVWLDPKGNHGKSWLTVHLWETGQALVVPRASATAEKLSAFVCSAWKGEPIVIIDLPRASKPTASLYEAIEEMKDGLVFDHRYQGKTRNIRGTKMIVFTNTPLDLKKLSADRWRLHGIEDPFS